MCSVFEVGGEERASERVVVNGRVSGCVLCPPYVRKCGNQEIALHNTHCGHATVTVAVRTTSTFAAVWTVDLGDTAATMSNTPRAAMLHQVRCVDDSTKLPRR